MVIDIICVIFAAYGFYLGFSKGIISTIFTVLSLFLGIIAGIKFAPAMTEFLENVLGQESPLMFVAGICLSFVLTMILIRMLARGLEGVLKTANINVINQAAGGLLLSSIMVLLFSILVWAGVKSHVIDERTQIESFSYKYLKPFPSQAYAVAVKFKPAFDEFWDYSLDVMDRLERISVERTEDNKVFDIEEDEQDKKKDNTIN